MAIALALCCLAASLLGPRSVGAGQQDSRSPSHVDVLVYGATPSGVSAALAASRAG